ncbi:MAG: tRNA (N6-threonylcarbamoyladenosine(37)-N6)-methyltransferase TrmO [Bacteroidetes bacterium]|nr:tRNA (N6-threonylcarbamoyladenosine(37)-N6)-methyltransferase TrmO [Bacteroidota bacterium]
MQKIIYTPIGIIHTPFNTMDNIPIQGAGGKGIKATIEIFPKFIAGLKDLEGFSHIILIYHLHLVEKHALIVKPFLDDELRGIFATRSPLRPNPIGMTTVRLIEINENRLIVEDIDMIDQSPLLDIKPCLPMIDDIQGLRLGWLTGKVEQFSQKKSDDRFKGPSAFLKE